MHLDYVRPSGQWSGEMVPGAADYQRFDVAQSKIVNGDGGGVWNPTSPIILGGAGLLTTTVGTAIQAGVTTKTGGRVQLANVSGNVPTFFTSMTDTICLNASDMLAATGGLGSGSSWLPDDYVMTSTAPQPVGAQGLAPPSTAAYLFLPIPRRYLHQGASLSKLLLHFRVPSKPTANASLPSLVFGPVVWTPLTNSTYATAPLWQGWLASHAFALGGYVIPPTSPTNYTNGFYYKATSISGTGTSGTNPAIFNGVTTIGATVTDNPGANQIIWTCTGHSGQLSQFGLDAATFYNNGKAQVLEFDFDNATGALLAQNAVDHSHYTYSISVGTFGDPSQILQALNTELLAVAISFTNIVDLRFT